LTFACDLSRVVVTIYSFSSVFSPVPSINSSTLKNLSILATTRLNELFDRTGMGEFQVRFLLSYTNATIPRDVYPIRSVAYDVPIYFESAYICESRCGIK